MVLASALMYGSYGVWSRLIGDVFGNFFQGWTRALIILILLVPFAFWKKEIVKIKKEDRKWVIIFMFFTSFTQAPLFYAFNHMGIGLASLLSFVSIFLTMYIIGVLYFSEKITIIKTISFLFAIIGMYLVFSFSVSYFTVIAAAMAIIHGIAVGCETSFSKKLSNKYSPLYLVIISWVIIFISNFIISVMIGEKQALPEITWSWFWVLCYSVTSLFAFWLVIIGFKYIDVGIGAIIGLLEIVFGILFGILIFNEALTLSVGVGAVLIITAAALPYLVELFCRKEEIKQII